jgi:tetratricopeptide (TPR) repeat protein
MKKRRSGQPESPGKKLQNFTDREDERALFARYVDLPLGGHLPVVSFYGVGGTGKTWLLQKLRETLPPAEELPRAHLDFAIARGGELYQRDPAAALAEIQRQLGVECPRFEVAYHVMLWKQGKRDSMTSVVEDAASTGWQIAIALGQDAASALIPGVNVAGKLLEKVGGPAGRRLRGTALGRWLESRGTSDFLRGLTARTAQEISEELVDFLAEDLHEALPRRPGRAGRAVLFFDTFEDLVRGAGRGGSRERAARQGWIQDLYRALLDDSDEPGATVLFVVAGRDQLVWPEDFQDPRYLDQHRVGGLSRTDARRFLAGCGIADAALQEAILRVAADDGEEGEEGDAASGSAEAGHHPFTLGLCADTVVGERARGGDPDAASFAMSPGDVRELVDRFLASFDGGQEAFIPWMYRLSLPPRWDEAAAREAFSPVVDAHQDAAWDALTSYSFVQPPAGADPWWGLHTRMRDALRARHAENEERVGRDHRLWLVHWAQRSREPADAFAGLAWYHLYCLDPSYALEQWVALAREARAGSRMADHHALLGWWAPTRLAATGTSVDLPEATALRALADELCEASLGSAAANLQRAIASLETALEVYSTREMRRDWAATISDMGTAHRALPGGDHDANVRRAIRCFEAALQVQSEADAPGEWGLTMNNLGNAWRDLPTGERAANLERAIRCHEAALRVAPAVSHRHRAAFWNNLGAALTELPTGDRTANLRRAIECYEEVLRLQPEDREPRLWGATKVQLGNALLELPDGERAENVRRAIEAYESAQRVFTEQAFPREWARTMTSLGRARSVMPTGDPAANLRGAIECNEAALRVLSEDATPREWSRTMAELGTLYAKLAGGDGGENLRRAIGCFQAALRVETEHGSPREWAVLMHNLGTAHRNLPPEQGPNGLETAIRCYEAALRVHSPDSLPDRHAATMDALTTARAMLAARVVPEADG